ncbi:MAG: hypothetical protein ACFNUR_01905 [Candidatus Saccharibacteria bacterium]
MGLYIKRDEERSKIQEKIAADLRAKSMQNSALDPEPITDLADQSNYMDGTKISSGLLGVWIVLGIAGIATILYLVIRSS